MKVKEFRNWKKRMAGGVFALMLVLNSLTAMACPDVDHVHDDSDAEHTCTEIDDFDEAVFIDEDGNVYPVDAYTPYKFCFKHDIVSGKLHTHVRNDSGGCTVKTYQTTKCTICNTIWVGDKISTVIWAKCPH